MMGKHIKIVFSTVAATLLLSAISANVSTAEEIKRKSAVSELEKNRYEQEVEQRLTRDIKAYLNHDFFITQVRSQLEKVDVFDVTEETITTQKPQQAQPPQTKPPLREKPVEQPLVNQMELDTADGINAQSIRDQLGVELPLPGLPLSDSMFSEQRPKTREKPQPQVAAEPVQQPEPPPIEYETKKEKKEKLLSSTVEVKQQNIKVMLDEHISPEQETFIRNLVIEKANVSFLRGDELRILRSKFPGATVLDEKPPEEPKDAKVEDPLNAKAEEKPPEDLRPEWQKVLENYWPFLAAASVLALLLLFILAKNRKKKAQIDDAPPPPATADKLEQLLNKLHSREDSVNENRLQAVREELVSMAVTDQGLVTTQLNDWLSSGNPQDMEKLANLYILFGEGLFKSLFKASLTPEKQVALAAKAQDLKESSSPDERLELAEAAYQALMQRRYQEQHIGHEDNRPFSFLERLNDDQILYLINEENIKVKALVFSQMASERAATMLKRISEQDRSRIAMEISKFSKLPVSAFQDIANRLAKRAVHAPSFANIAMDGLDLLVDMLDFMDSASEMSLLGALKRENPDLYYQIKKVYVSFQDLVQLPKLALKNIIRESEREQLALALFDMDDAYQEGIYAVMLERPRAMLQSLIRGLQQPDEAAINEAKRAIARRARAMLKSGELDSATEQAS